MDVQTALVCVGVFFGSAVVVCLISVFGIKERTFEEAIEEQKRRSQEEVLCKTEKPKKDKKYKKWSRQKKEKNEKYQEEESPVEKCNSCDHVEFKPEPEFIAESDGETKSPKSKKHKVNLGKPILVKKDDVPLTESISEALAEVDARKEKKESVTREFAEEPKKASEPIFVKETHRQEIKAARETNSIETDTSRAEAPVAASAPKKKKAKLEHFENGDFISGAKLLSLMKNAVLTDMDVQTLINFLLNKQGEASGWMKKNDPVTTLKKQLQEKEQALEVEQKQTQAATSKLRELRKELNQEKSKLTTAEQASREKIGQLQQEIQALQLRMKSTHEQHVTETSSTQTKLQQLQAKLTESTNENAKLQKEKSSLENTISTLEFENKGHAEEISELQSKLKKIEEFQSETEKKLRKISSSYRDQKYNLEEQNKELEGRIQELISSHETECKDLQQKLSSTNTQLKSIEKTCSVISQELKDKKSVCSDLETDNNTLKHRLQAMESIVKDREQEIKKLQASLEETCMQRTELESRLEQLQNKLEELTKSQEEEIRQTTSTQLEHENLSQFPIVGERTSAEGEEAPHYHQNGDVRQELDKSSPKKMLELTEHERIVEEKQATLERLWDEVNQHKSTIANLSEELAVQKQKNNELREKNWKAMEALSTAEKTAEMKIEQMKRESEEKLIKSQKEVETRIQEAKRQFDQNGKTEEAFIQDLRDAKERAEESLKSVEQRLRDQSVMSEKRLNQIEELQHRLQDLQMTVNNKTKELSSEFDMKIKTQQKKEQELLRRIFPDVEMAEQLEHSVWVSQFECKALNLIGTMKHNTVVEAEERLQAEVDELKNQVVAIKEEKEKTVQHYKTVLAETESILNKLQNSVEHEELEWKKKLKSKEQELEKISKESKELLAEKKTLESSLRQFQGLEETTSEMQLKLKELQVKLEGEEAERKVLEQKLEEANQSALKFKEDFDAKSKQIEELRKESVSFENVKKELQQIKAQLEKEKKITKDLSAQTVKLSSLVKIGQDALRAEEETVKKLQAQLQSSENTNLNGAAEERRDVSSKK